MQSQQVMSIYATPKPILSQAAQRSQLGAACIKMKTSSSSADSPAARKTMKLRSSYVCEDCQRPWKCLSNGKEPGAQESLARTSPIGRTARNLPAVVPQVE